MYKTRIVHEPVSQIGTATTARQSEADAAAAVAAGVVVAVGIVALRASYYHYRTD